MMIAKVKRKIEYRLRDRWLANTFANGPDLVKWLRGGPPVHRIELPDGTSISHPAGIGGFIEALVEVWYERSYLPRGFYTPRSGDVIVDIGANIGLFSLQVLRASNDCRVVAVEPFEENFACLKQNLSYYPANRAAALQVAVGRSSGRGTMKRVGERSLDHVLQTDTSGNGGVPVLTLDELLDEHVKSPRIALLKMDIEGSERDVLESASDASLARCDHIAIEYHDHIKPGCLSLIQQRLSPTHNLRVKESPCPGCGLVIATLR